MVALTGEGSSRAARGLATRWGILFGILVLLFGGTVFTLNTTLYSASGFVSGYLDALARHDLDGALSMPGVTQPEKGAPTLLTREGLGPLQSYTLISDEADGSSHKLSYDVQFTDTIRSEITFVVEHTGARLGVFSGWKFTDSPIGVLHATPLHAADFEVNGIGMSSPGGPGKPTLLQVMTPGIYTLTHESKYLVGEKSSYLAADSRAATLSDIDIQPSEEFVNQVNTELAEFFDECATQQILQPTGCPFGKQIVNVVQGLPSWSIALYPQVTIQPGEKPGEWAVPTTPAAAHVKVQVKSLFDGTLSIVDEDVPFDVSYKITFPGDGSLLITPR